ncbi:uncharacterized protein V6R79_006557 [Siganus canaliculatus]
MSAPSSSNASLLVSSVSFDQAMYSFLYSCIQTTVGTLTITAFAIVNILLLFPLYVFVIYLGFQRWRRQRSRMSHSDVFAYHMVATELLSVTGSTLCVCAVYTDAHLLLEVALVLMFINFNGQVSFHILTCVERYLAVVHPVAYRNSMTAKVVRVRNVTIGCLWLLLFLGTGFLFVDTTSFVIIFLLSIGTALTVISFCSVSVLRVLISPGPGDGGAAGSKVDQTKLKPFYTIMAIMGVLLVRFGGCAVSMVLFRSLPLEMSAKCGLRLSMVWYGLPSSAVLPLLFLQRAGKLQCRRNSTESG